MKLKVLIVLISLLLICATPITSDDYNAANAFAAAYNHWAMLRSATPIGTWDAHEPAAWKAVQRAWKDLNSAVKYDGSK